MLLVIAVGLGLGEVFKVFPWAYTVLRYVGAAYLLYLAWKIATAGGMSDSNEEHGKPMTFLGAAAFQWVNPKAWIMALGAITTYTPAEGYVTNVLVIALVFAVFIIAIGHAARRGDLPGQIQQVRRAHVAQHRVGPREHLEHFAQAQADRNHQQHETDTDPQRMRH